MGYLILMNRMTKEMAVRIAFISCAIGVVVGICLTLLFVRADLRVKTINPVYRYKQETKAEHSKYWRE